MTSHDFEILIDGECPLCRREAALLRRLDRDHGRYSQPSTVTELLRLMHQYPDARVVAGGEHWHAAE